MTNTLPKTGAGAIPKRPKPLKSPVTLLDNEQIDSPAMLAMVSTGKSGYPLLVYLHFLQKRIRAKNRRAKKGHERLTFANAHELAFSYEEAERLGINNRAFRLGIDKLIEHGFIDITKAGNGLVRGDCTIYGLSNRWRKFGTPDFEPASRTMVAYGFCAETRIQKAIRQPDEIRNCTTCAHSLGGQLNQCSINHDVAINQGHVCRRHTRWN